MNSIKPNFIIIPVIALLVAILGSFYAGSGLSSWYLTLNLPKIAPPGWIIMLAWTIIYILTTISALMVWNKITDRGKHFWIIAFLFILNAFLNVLWSYLFFDQHLVTAAFIEMIFLGLTILALISLIWPLSKQASLLLTPYLAWVLFAAYVTFRILRLN